MSLGGGLLVITFMTVGVILPILLVPLEDELDGSGRRVVGHPHPLRHDDDGADAVSLHGEWDEPLVVNTESYGSAPASVEQWQSVGGGVGVLSDDAESELELLGASSSFFVEPSRPQHPPRFTRGDDGGYRSSDSFNPQTSQTQQQQQQRQQHLHQQTATFDDKATSKRESSNVNHNVNSHINRHGRRPSDSSTESDRTKPADSDFRRHYHSSHSNNRRSHYTNGAYQRRPAIRPALPPHLEFSTVDRNADGAVDTHELMLLCAVVSVTHDLSWDCPTTPSTSPDTTLTDPSTSSEAAASPSSPTTTATTTTASAAESIDPYDYNKNAKLEQAEWMVMVHDLQLHTASRRIAIGSLFGFALVVAVALVGIGVFSPSLRVNQVALAASVPLLYIADYWFLTEALFRAVLCLIVQLPFVVVSVVCLTRALFWRSAIPRRVVSDDHGDADGDDGDSKRRRSVSEGEREGEADTAGSRSGKRNAGGAEKSNGESHSAVVTAGFNILLRLIGLFKFLRKKFPHARKAALRAIEYCLRSKNSRSDRRRR